MKCGVLILLALWLAPAAQLWAQLPPNGSYLFQNLQKLGTSYNVNNPEVESLLGNEGPKGLAAADLDGDGRNDLVAANHDGSVAVLFGTPSGGFEPAKFLTAGDPRGLRDVIAADVSGDLRPEIIAAHPFEGKLYIFSMEGGAGSRTFSTPVVITTWPGARSVTAGDFDGDGKMDLAVGGAGDGFREYRGDGTGGFTALPPVTEINAGPAHVSNGSVDSAKPVFTMHAWRKTGESQDRLAVSFAGAGYIWFLQSAGLGQPLAVSSVMPLLKDESVYDLTMDYLSPQSRASGEPDLITAATWSGEVFIRYRVTPNPAPYETVPQVRLGVPGAPRAVATADVNGDHWPDLLVASRQGNTLSLYLNNAGTLSLSSQTPAGSSPRDVVSADFDHNGLPDAAVINLDSQDITVHRINPATGWFLQNRLIQKIPGGAASLSITNLDGGPRSELIYLNRATGDANIMRIGGDSLWTTPERYQMGVRPETLSTPDLNGDSLPDLLTTSSGDWQSSGGLSYRLQLPNHTFGPLVKLQVPGSPVYATYAALAQDFNGDGKTDLITAGYFDSQALFFEGTANGLVFRKKAALAPYIRSMAAADLDQDGDIDLVAVGAYGDLTIVENDGTWFAEGPVQTQVFSGVQESGAYAVKVLNRNDDGDPDLTVLGVKSVTQWNGGSGTFMLNAGTTSLPPTLGAGDSQFDYDGNGFNDAFALTPSMTRCTFFKGTASSTGAWWNNSGASYTVPSCQELATGDLDGDGKPDLAGAGEHLWAVLSSAPSLPPAPVPSPSIVPDLPSVTINEVLANTSEFIAPGSNKAVDCVEIFNGTGAPVDLTNWILRIDPNPGQEPKPDFVFPAATLAVRDRVVIFCTEKTGPWQAPFKLPADGGTLRLISGTGLESDAVSYPPQQPDVTYARIFDGSRNFVFSPFPGIGSPNYDNGNVDPRIEFKGVDTALLQSGTWRFRAKAWDDSGMQSMSIQWRALSGATGTGGNSGIVPLYDDGQHDDGAALDGEYAGDLLPAIPPGMAIEFYLTGTDRLWQSSTLPEGPQFTLPGQPIKNYSLGLPLVAPGWEISEVVSTNLGSLTDTDDTMPDWAEVRYAGADPAPVDQIFLCDSLFELKPSKMYDLSRQLSTVTPGTTLVVLLTGQADSGANANHAPFSVNNDGDSIYLIHRLPSGATELVDAVKVPRLPPDVAWARMGIGGPFLKTTPTPYAPNAGPGGLMQFIPGALPGTGDVIIAFSGAGGVEASDSLGSWLVVLPRMPDTGFERAWREPVQARRFFRIK